MTLPEDMDPIMRRIRALEKEVASLRGRNPLASATLDDEDGNRRINFGRLPSGGFGVEVFDTDGRTVFRVDEGGMRAPALNLPYRRAQEPVSVTGTAWETVTWEMAVGSRTHPAIRWQSLIAADPGTAGEARLLLGASETSGVVAIPAATADRYTWNWAPSTWPIGTGGASLMRLQVRRTSGTGALHSYAPDQLFMGTIEDLGATPSGL